MKLKKVIVRTLLVFGSCLLIVLIAIGLFVHTQTFNRFAIRKIVEEAQLNTGGQLTIDNLAIHWGQLKVDVYGLVLRKPSLDAPPLLTCDHVGVGLTILSFWSHKIALSELTMDRPVIRILTDAGGETNVPHSNSPSHETVSDKLFDVAIRHFALNSGEFDYNNQETPIAADLHDLRAQVQFNVAKQIYKGSLAYDRGRIAMAKLTPFDHDGQIEFEADRSTLSIHSLALSVGDTRLAVRGTLSDYSNPRVQASYEATVFTPDVARVLNTPSIPKGVVRTSGSLQYAYKPHETFLTSIRVEGQADAPSLDVSLGEVLTRARQVRANYVLNKANIDVRDVVANALGGSLTGTFSMTNLSARPSARLKASVRGASLAEVSRMVPLSDSKPVTLAGRTDADVQATWTGAITDANAHLHATITGPLTPPTRHTIPLNGLLDVHYDGRRDIAVFAPSALRTENTQVSFDGTLGNSSSLSVQASAKDLVEVSQLASAIESAGNVESKTTLLASLGLRGSANFSGQIQGSPKAPEIRGHVTGNNVVVKGTMLPLIQSDVDLGASGISLQNAVLDLHDKGHVKLNAHANLRDWSFGATSPVSLQANASDISVADLLRLADLRYPAAGNLNANISLRGSESNPSGQATIDVSNASAWGESVKQLALRFQGNGNSIDAKMQLQLPAGTVSGDVNYFPKTQQYEGRMDAPKLELSRVHLPASQGLAAHGTASLSASGKGTIKNPQFNAQVQIPQVQIENQTISQVRAQIDFVNQHASFVLNSIVVGGYAQAKGDLDLRGNYPATASVDVRALPLGALLSSYLPQVSNTLQGETELHATLSGPLKQPDEIKAQVHVPTLNLTYQSVRLNLADPMRLNYAHGVLNIASADITGTGTNLSIHGTVPVRSSQTLNVTANGTIDLSLIQSFNPSVKSSGQIKVQVAAGGSVSVPTMQGDIQVQKAMVSSETFPLGLEGINGRIRVTGNRLDIEQLQGMAGGGNLSILGFLTYGKETNFNLSAQAKSVRLRYPEGLRTLLDGSLNLTGSPDSSSLTGRVLIDRLSFTQQFDMATLISTFSSEIPSTAPPLFEQNMKLNVALASSSQLNVTSSKLSIGGSANLTVQGTLVEPVILGRVVLTQGEVFFLGKRYEIQSGTIAFANPVRTDPVLNIYAKTTVQQYNITLNFIGPLDRLRTNYTSDPPLSESDIIHLVAFGTTAEEAATTSTPTSLAAESILAQGVSSQLSGKLESLTGISQISLDPLVTNSAADPGSQIAIQERVSGTLLVTFSTDVASTQYQTIEVQYRAQNNMMISVIRDYNGGYALDLRIRKTF
jgi:translocation and assembly module TamB